MPRDSGVTSRRSTSLTSPLMMAAWMAAPMATHSMGSTPRSIFFPKKSSTNFWTMGMRVGPPTMMILSISAPFSPNCTPSLANAPRASRRAVSSGARQRWTIGPMSSSSLARFTVMVRCFGPVASAVMKGRLMSVDIVLESSTFAFSAASRTRCVAIVSFFRSMPVWRWNSFST